MVGHRGAGTDNSCSPITQQNKLQEQGVIGRTAEVTVITIQHVRNRQQGWLDLRGYTRKLRPDYTVYSKVNLLIVKKKRHPDISKEESQQT